MKKILSIVIALSLILTCVAALAEEATVYKVGICNYVDHISLNQIVENIRGQLEGIGGENNVVFDIRYENCNADSSVMQQIISDFITDGVDLMVAVATPVAMTMQGMTEDNNIPVVFAAVSDPLAVGLVDSLEAPGANVTGTSDYLNTNAMLNLILAANPDTATVGLLYDLGQDASTAAIADAKAFLEEKNIAYVDYTGTNMSEVILAADAAVNDGVDALFTPTDNTIMTAELSIYEALSEAGIPHYAGANSFARNGAFVGYGVDYANLGIETANMIADILLNGADPATTPVKTFDNGIATLNTEIAEALNLDVDALEAAFQPFCTAIELTTTGEDFEG